MIELLLISAVGVAAISLLALLMPCKACHLRRERLRKAYESWQATRANK